MINWCLPVLCAVFLWHLGASSETRNTFRLGKPKGETPCRDFYAKEIVCNKNITNESNLTHVGHRLKVGSIKRISTYMN